MKLRELEAQFIKYIPRDGQYEGDGHLYVDTLAEADGIVFLCPLCFAANAGPIGTHSVICWFEGKVPDEVSPKPGRWNPVGSSIDDLTFVPGAKSNSVQLLGGCNWHGFIKNGDAA